MQRKLYAEIDQFFLHPFLGYISLAPAKDDSREDCCSHEAAFCVVSQPGLEAFFSWLDRPHVNT